MTCSPFSRGGGGPCGPPLRRLGLLGPHLLYRLPRSPTPSNPMNTGYSHQSHNQHTTNKHPPHTLTTPHTPPPLGELTSIFATNTLPTATLHTHSQHPPHTHNSPHTLTTPHTPHPTSSRGTHEHICFPEQVHLRVRSLVQLLVPMVTELTVSPGIVLPGLTTCKFEQNNKQTNKQTNKHCWN